VLKSTMRHSIIGLLSSAAAMSLPGAAEWIGRFVFAMITAACGAIVSHYINNFWTKKP
jgi:hypothetical protein